MLDPIKKFQVALETSSILELEKDSSVIISLLIHEGQTWGIMEMQFLTSCKPISFMGCPSKSIFPVNSVRRNNAWMIELFPAPVRPTMPI